MQFQEEEDIQFYYPSIPSFLLPIQVNKVSSSTPKKIDGDGADLNGYLPKRIKKLQLQVEKISSTQS